MEKVAGQFFLAGLIPGVCYIYVILVEWLCSLYSPSANRGSEKGFPRLQRVYFKCPLRWLILGGQLDYVKKERAPCGELPKPDCLVGMSVDHSL